jgi:alkanesulfonate monooxygenase SsuD/methylene tetrahydromethanopterin reductase-like flavin-dependent oxidoreductase (luciferase family)
MAAAAFGIFDHVDRSDEPLGALYEHRLKLVEAAEAEVVRRYGYEEAAAKIQDLYLAGRKAEAEAAVPDALVDEVTLCGPKERIRERLAEWKAAGVTTLGVRGKIEAIRLMAELAL